MNMILYLEGGKIHGDVQKTIFDMFSSRSSPSMIACHRARSTWTASSPAADREQAEGPERTRGAQPPDGLPHKLPSLMYFFARTAF